MKLIALLYCLRGSWLEKREAVHKAEDLFLKASRQAPVWATPWGHLALLYKKEKNWPQMLQCSQTAAELNPRDRAAWWNLGIAATALEEWTEVRRAWRALEIASPLGSLDVPGPPVAIRVDPLGCAEVVLCSRLDPARAVVRCVPLPRSGRRFGDLLLHDGVPNDLRVVGGKEIPVFDELEVLMASPHVTWEVTVAVPSPEDVTALIETAQRRGLGAEDWSSARWYIPSGGPGWFPEPPRVVPQPEGQFVLGFGAPSEEELRAVLDDWVGRREGCAIVKGPVLADGKRSGWSTPTL